MRSTISDSQCACVALRNGERDMRLMHSNAAKRIGRCALWLSGLVIVFAGGGIGCSSKSSAADEANKKRWEQWQKANPPATNDLEAAYQRRQAQLAARRAKAAQEKAKAQASPETGAKESSVKPSPSPPASGK